MIHSRVVIVGAGLSGLYAAYLLERQGVENYVLLEARNRVGGRVKSARCEALRCPAAGIEGDEHNRFDLGATWFWPALQPRLDRLMTHLGLERFAQYEAGDMLVERSPREPSLRIRGYAMSPPSMRVAGGMGALADALSAKLSPGRLLIDQRVRRVRRADPLIELDVEDSQGGPAVYRAEAVLLAVPPRLAASCIDFAPAMPDSLSRVWRDTPTWMASHAKYVAVYEAPFWREQGLSGGARSHCGPLTEIHDASVPGGDAALFGFFGMTALARKALSEDELRQRCREQLARMFGAQAGRPSAEFVKDWAADVSTATLDDQLGMAGHPSPPTATVQSGAWRGSLIGIASEWSPEFSGYVAGAIDAASKGVSALLHAASYETNRVQLSDPGAD
jgi:monoamine oxidase